MENDALRLASFLAYLGAWVAVAVGAIAGGLPKREPREGAAATGGVGVLLQGAALLPVTLTLSEGSLRPAVWEMVTALALAPLGAAMYGWALRSGKAGLVTGGAFAVVRHPMYLGFFALLLATGLLASARWTLAAAVALYIAGTELRVSAEEAELEARFPDGYSAYRRVTRWRYLWGLR